MEENINPRWLKYCEVHNTTLENEQKLYPGGSMTGFMLWIREQRNKWLEVNKGYSCEADFDTFLGIV
jgi:hypothetical protein